MSSLLYNVSEANDLKKAYYLEVEENEGLGLL